MSTAARLAIVLVAFIAGVMLGIRYHAGQDAIAARKADDIRQADARQQRQFVDLAAGKHAAALVTLNTQLENAREKIKTLSGRDCLAPDVVRLLNAIGDSPVRAAAVDPAGAAAAASAGTGLRYSTDADTAGAIATCRARFAEVASQVNQILDVEDRRHPPGQDGAR